MSAATAIVTKNLTGKVPMASSRPDFRVRMMERLPPTTGISLEGEMCSDPAAHGRESWNKGHDQGAILSSDPRPASSCPARPRASQPYTELNDAGRQQLLLDHLPQVRYVAQRIHNRIPRQVPIEDLVNSGILGLMEAVRKYDPSRNVPLKHYAEFRIQGAILDSLRQVDWIPRGLRRRARKLEQVISNYKSRFGRDPDEPELAAALGVGLLELQRLQGDLRPLQADPIEPSGEDSVPSRMVSEEEGPYHQALRSEMSGLLAKVMGELPDRERQVLARYYFEEKTMKEVGVVLGIGESRVSQIHSAALLQLRTLLGTRLKHIRPDRPHTFAPALRRLPRKPPISLMSSA